MSTLVPKQTVDVNNRLTTVYVNPDKGAQSTASERRISSLNSPPTSRGIRVGDTTYEVSATYASPFAPQDSDGEWTGEFLNHQFLLTNGSRTLTVAPPGFPGMFCDVCGSFLDYDSAEPRLFTCHVCGNEEYTGKYHTALRDDQIRFVSPDEVVKERWFHVTARQDWDYAIGQEGFDKQPLVHMGSFEAARQRGLDNYSEHQQLYLFEIQITDDAPIRPGIIHDDNYHAPRSIHDARSGPYQNYAAQYQVDGVTAYLNKYEDIGSVSLIAHPSAFTVVEMREFEPSDW